MAMDGFSAMQRILLDILLIVCGGLAVELGLDVTFRDRNPESPDGSPTH